jgi:hypothetical protein
MRSKKQLRSLLPGVRRLLASVVSSAAKLADAHPMVFIVSPPREHTHEREAQPHRN